MTTCERCGIDCAVYASPVSTGYGRSPEGKILCFACCGVMDQEQMAQDGRATLYLVMETGARAKVTNWPASLIFAPYHVRKGHHNIARTRYDVWFVGPDGFVWHGVQYGEWTQVCHCRRTKERAA